MSGWETMKGLVPHWKPTSPSPLSSAVSSGLSSGEGGDPAFGDSGESNGGSAGSYVDVCAVLACAVRTHRLGTNMEFLSSQHTNENAQGDATEGGAEGERSTGTNQ